MVLFIHFSTLCESAVASNTLCEMGKPIGKMRLRDSLVPFDGNEKLQIKGKIERSGEDDFAGKHGSSLSDGLDHI